MKKVLMMLLLLCWISPSIADSATYVDGREVFSNVAITGGTISGVTASGKISIITDGATGNVTAAQMEGQTHVVTGAYTLSLPTAAVGYKAKFKASTAAVFSLDVVTGTDVIIFPAVYTCPKDAEFDPTHYYIPRIWLNNVIGSNLAQYN